MKIGKTNGTKRFTAVLLSVLMLLSAVVLPVGAETVNDMKRSSNSIIYESHESDETEIISSGNCGANGDNVKYELHKSGTLYIYGDGGMHNYDYSSPFYYKNISKIIINAVIEPGVTSIGKNAFEDCPGLTSVEIPNSVTSIGDFAFDNCDSLTSIEIPNSVTSIGDCAFIDCTSLTSIEIPNSVANIGAKAFYECSSLKDVYYTGTEEQWKKISIGGNNSRLTSAEIHYNSYMPDSDNIPVVSEFTIDSTVTGTVNEEIRINGKISLDSASDNAEEILTKAVNDVKWTVDNRENAEVVNFSPIYSADYTTATYTLIVKPLKTGTFTITGETSGLSASCKITAVSETKTFTEGIIPLDFRSDTNENKTINHVFYYSDNFFENKSTVYNHDLAIMTLGLVMSGFSSGESDDYWAITSKEAEELRSKHIREAYKKLGFDVEDIELYNYDVSLNDSSDKVAFSIAHKEITINGKSKNLVAVILRGGGYGAEWSSNFNVGNNEMFHEAFNTAATNVMTSVIQYLGERQLTNDTKIWIGGFSRAAATANLLTAKLDKLASQGSFYSISRDDIYTYTFATPQGVVDNSINNIHSELYNNIFNIINPCDVVPTVALSKWGFGRYGQSLTLPYTYAGVTEKNKGYVEKVSKKYNAITQNSKDNMFESFLSNMSQVSEVDESLYKLAKSTDVFVNDKYQAVIRDTLKLLYTNRLIDGLSNKKVSSKDFENDVATNFLICFNINFSNAKSNVFNDSTNKHSRKINTMEIAKIGLSYFNVKGDTDIDINKVETLVYSIYILIDRVSTKDDKVLESLESTSLILSILKLKSSLGSVGNNHYPELYLAWLESYDAKELFGNRTYKKITASCPVNVDIYSSDGTLLASVVDGEVVEELIPVYLDNDSKEIWLIDEDDYDIVITAYDDGKMTYSVEEYNQDFDLQNKTNFYDINLEKGNTYETTVSLSNSSDSQQENTTVLDKNNNVSIEPREVINPDNSNSYVEVTVSSDENGYVYGNQTAIKGEYVSVYATAKDGYKLKGWYLDKTLVSTDETYYFTAKEDTNLNAVFVKDILDTDSDVDSDIKQNTDTDTDSDIKKNTDNDTDSDIKKNTDNDTDSDIKKNTDTDTDSDIKKNTDNDTDSDTKKNTDTDTDSDTKKNTDNDTDSDIKKNTDTDTDSDIKKNTDNDTDSDTKKNTDTDTDSDTKNPTKPDKPKDPTPIGTVGDLDGDGKITSADSLFILRASVKLENLTAEKFKLADVDNDGNISSSDALLVLRHSVGFKDTDTIGNILYK